MNNYQKSMILGNSVAEVYQVLTAHISDWWSNDLTGSATHPGDSFNIAFGETRKTMEILTATPNEEVIWKCTKAWINNAALSNKAEWEGTKMIWTLSAADQGTTLHFLHEGLNQSLECYNVCENGWNMFLGSLQDYLTTGKGRPYLKKDRPAQ